MPERNIKTKIGLILMRFISKLSQKLKLGSGTVIGGKVLLLLSPNALNILTSRKDTVLVSGTNGKTTTSYFIAKILSGCGLEVASNSEGANMEAGLLTAVANNPDCKVCVFETDEHWLPEILKKTHPKVIVLLNLTRDQLDRTTEVRTIAQRWEKTFRGSMDITYVANCDDPLVAYSILNIKHVIWVSAGSNWTLDSNSCPLCGKVLEFSSDSNNLSYYKCTNCEFKKPNPDYVITSEKGEFTLSKVSNNTNNQIRYSTFLPGQFNGFNAGIAMVAANQLKCNFENSAVTVKNVTEVAGRYSIKYVKPLNLHVRLILAKNPAGWQEALNLIDPKSYVVIVAINAEIPDGKDPSWLFDVPFELIKSKFVIATGKRANDLAVRLSYADVNHQVIKDYPAIFNSTALKNIVQSFAERKESANKKESVESNISITDTPVKKDISSIDLIANYSAFQDFLKLEFT